MNPSPSPLHAKRRPLAVRVLRASALLVASVTVGIGLFYAVENFRGSREWAGQKTHLTALRFPLNLEAVLPPEVPDAVNFARHPLFEGLFDYEPGHGFRDTNAFRIAKERLQFVPGRPWSAQPPEAVLWKEGRGTDLAEWQACFRSPLTPAARRDVERGGGRLPVLPDTPQAPAADVLQALSVLQPDFDLFAQAVRARPQCRYPLRYQDGYACVLPHLAVLKHVAQRFSLRASARLALERSTEALDDIETILRLADTLESEPFLISLLVRAALLEIALQPVWEGTGTHAFTEAQIAALEARLGRIDLLPDWQHAMSMEQVQAIRFIEQAAGSTLARREMAEMITAIRPPIHGPDQLPDGVLRTYFNLAPRGWLLASLAATSRSITAAAAFMPADIPHLRASMGQEGSPQSLRLLVHQRLFEGEMGGGSLARSFIRVVRTQTHLRLALIALDLEQYRLRRGTLPNSLQALAAEPQLDPVDRKPLRYRTSKEGGFILWSIGEDGVDQGGLIAVPNSEGGAEPGDWVWKSP